MVSASQMWECPAVPWLLFSQWNIFSVWRRAVMIRHVSTTWLSWPKELTITILSPYYRTVHLWLFLCMFCLFCWQINYLKHKCRWSSVHQNIYTPYEWQKDNLNKRVMKPKWNINILFTRILLRGVIFKKLSRWLLNQLLLLHNNWKT